MAEEVKENNKQLVCEIKIDIEMMRKIIDEKMTQTELDIQEIRAKAIDEFFQELQKYEEDDMWLRLKMSSIYEIAEQLKEGGKNE